MYGVIDHNLFDYRTKSNQSINIHMSGWGGHDNGDGSWAEPPYYGSEKFIFIEDNCFNNTNGHTGGWIDGWHGGRYVIVIITPTTRHRRTTEPRLAVSAASGAWKFITTIFIGTAFIHP